MRLLEAINSMQYECNFLRLKVVAFTNYQLLKKLEARYRNIAVSAFSVEIKVRMETFDENQINTVFLYGTTATGKSE